MHKHEYGVITLLGRGFLTAMASTFAALGLGLFLALPTSPISRLTLEFCPIALVLAQLLGRSRPITVILRRFGRQTMDGWLFAQVLLRVNPWSRTVWLVDPSVPRVATRHYSPVVLYVVSFMFPLTLLAIMLERMNVRDIILAVAACGFAHYFLIALAGAGSKGAVLSGTAILFLRPKWDRLEEPTLTHFAVVFALLAIASVSQGGLYVARHILRCPQRWISNRLDLMWLWVELRTPIWLAPRFVSAGLSVVDQLSVCPNPQIWHRAVDSICHRSRVVIADATDLAEDTGLEWELKRASELGCCILVLSPESKTMQHIEHLRRLTPKSLILSSDAQSPKTCQEWLRSGNGCVIHMVSFGNRVDLHDRLYPLIDSVYRYTVPDWLNMHFAALEGRLVLPPINTLRSALFHFLCSSASFVTTMESYRTLWVRLTGFDKQFDR